MSNPEKRKGFFNFWLKKVPETGLNFTTIYHLASNAYSPINMKRRIYGVFDEKYLKPLAELFQKLRYTKFLVFNGEDGLDEISNIGETRIIEFYYNKFKNYTITPENLGIKKTNADEIKGKSKEENIKDFLNIIYGKEKGAKMDLALINAGAAFYVMDAVNSLKDGVKLGLDLINNNVVAKKFENYVKDYGDINKLNELKKKYV